MKICFDKNQKKDLISIIVALLLFFTVMLLVNCNFLTFADKDSLYVGFLYLIPYVIVGHPVLKGCVNGIVHGKIFDEKFLMTLATLGAVATREYGEAVAVMLFYQIGEFFQNYAVDKSRRSIKELMEIAPAFAIRECRDGRVEQIDPDEVNTGDVLIIKPGEKVPVDGVIIFGESELNTAAITGESMPIYLETGDNVISGSINGDSLIKIKAEKTYDDSTVAKILELVEESLDKKSKSEKFITKFAKYYTPIVVIAALLLFLIPSIVTREWTIWMLRACTFLVISCPCALVISVPLTFFGGIGAASREGILIKGSNYLETLSNINTILTDKTGTITTGEFEVVEIETFNGVAENELLSIAAAIEASSSHPIAKSICKAYTNLPISSKKCFDVSKLQNISGLGMNAVISDDEVFVGNSRLMKERKIEIPKTNIMGGTLVYVARNLRLIGIISVVDKEKNEAKHAVEELRKNGIKKIYMLTGDREEAANIISDRVGLDGCYAGLLPEDKVRIVKEFIDDNSRTNRNGGKKSGLLAYIGDGINDAPVLSRVDVGIAMGGAGSDVAIEAADIVIMDDNLDKLNRVINIAKKTMKIAWQNIAFALIIKILFLILGAFGVIGMWWAVFADVGVAVICILNAMRMLKKSRNFE